MVKLYILFPRQEAKRRFYQIARKAIKMGLLTPDERDTIRRHATRKRGNWARHLRNLCDYLDHKQQEETCKRSSDTSSGFESISSG